MTTEQTRKDRIKAAVEAHDPGQHERISLPWRGGAETFPVVSVELDIALLNPRSHRIRAQLESNKQAHEAIVADPFSDEAQGGIAQILRDTLGFEDLATNLKEEGQQQPGVVTRTGLLVNANTRAVALRAEGAKYIRAAVLPEDATEEEIADLELKLQMQKEFRQEYTYTNELLFVDELIGTHNQSPEAVAKALRWAPSSQEKDVKKGKARIEQATRVLSLIREIQALSASTMPLTDFDDQQVALEELDTQYRDLITKDPKAAQRLKQTRILGLLVNLPYRDIRELDSTFVQDHLVEAIEEDDILRDSANVLLTHPSEQDEGASPPGLDLLEDHQEDETDDGLGDIGALVELLATSRGQETVQVPTSEGTNEIPREALIDAVTDSLKVAVDASRRAAKDEDRLKKPSARIAEADTALRQALESYEAVADDADFDLERFKRGVEKAERRVAALKDVIK